MAGKKKRKKYRLFWFFAKLQLFLFLLLAVGLSYYFFGGYAKAVQNLKEEAISFVHHSDAETFKQSQTSIVYAADQIVISTLKGEKDSYYLSFENIPTNAISAIVSIEDKKFYRHDGVDYRAILRAVKAMIQNGEVTQGGSTITMQLARNIFLSQEKTWQRKVEEMFIAQELEKKYSKEEILEFYLNNIYFGNGYYGIQAAGKGYFNREVQELDLSQLAFLCAIPNNPTVYDPLTNMDNTISRRNRILKNMLEDGKISELAYADAVVEELTLERPPGKTKNDYVETYAYYCATRTLMELEGFEFKREFILEEAEELYDRQYDELYSECQKKLYTGGYRIYTSLDLQMQQSLQESLNEKLAKFTEVNEEGVYKLQSSAVCIDNDSGYVKAIVGGRNQDFAGYTLNRAYQSFRQPGSAIKPLIVYTPCFEGNYTPSTMVVDEPIEDGPKNSNGTYLGEMTVRTAVEKSVNTIAWRLFSELTPEVGLSYLQNMNFSRLDNEDYRPGSALGGFTTGVSALEMASGYAAIENDGIYRKPTCIVKILDADGNEIYASKPEEVQVYKQNAARTMTDVLTGVFTNGTAKGLGLGEMPCAGKTGTTNDNKDGWFVGYTRYYTTSVWVGYDMPEELKGLAGSTYPGGIWQDFMQKIHQNLEPLAFLPYVKSAEESEPEVPLEEGEELLEGEEPESLPEDGEAPVEGAEPENGTNPDADQNLDQNPSQNVDVENGAGNGAGDDPENGAGNGAENGTDDGAENGAGNGTGMEGGTDQGAGPENGEGNGNANE